MTTRKDLREDFYAEIETAVDGVLDPSDITQEYPDSIEDLPCLVHSDSYRPIPMGVNTAPKEIDKSGDVITYIYSVPMQAQFTLTMLSSSEMQKEAIYNAVRSYFEKYTFPIKDVETINPDANRMELLDAVSQDDESREPTARGDALSINLDYERLVTNDHEPIEEVNTIFETVGGSETITKTTT